MEKLRHWIQDHNTLIVAAIAIASLYVGTIAISSANHPIGQLVAVAWRMFHGQK